MTYTTVSETVEAFNEALDDNYGDYEVAGLIFQASDILKNLDPIGYKTYWIDWANEMGIDTDELEDDYVFESDR